MVEINLTIVIQVVQFLILVFVLNRLLFKPIGLVIEERQEKIFAWEDKTRSLQDTVGEKLGHYETQLQEARAQAREKQEQLNGEVREQEEAKLRATSEEAIRVVDSAKQTLQQETERLRSELRQLAVETSKMMAEKVLGRKVS
jgi:F-type H+-transporting ATPase subunit b